MGARNRGGIGLSYRPARPHRLAEFIPWNQFRGPISFKNTGSDRCCCQAVNVPAHVKTIRYRVGLYTNEVPRKHHVHKVGQSVQEMPNTVHVYSV
jgi:hypothetical protein